MDNPIGMPSIESFLSIYKCANLWLEVGCLDGLMGCVFCTPLDLIDFLLTHNGMAPGGLDCLVLTGLMCGCLSPELSPPHTLLAKLFQLQKFCLTP